MFALPGILALIVFLVARPFDLVPALKGLPLLYVFAAAAIGGYWADVRLRFTEWRAARQFSLALVLVLWCVLTIALRAPGTMVKLLLPLLISFLTYFVLAHGVRTFKAFEVVAAVLLGCALFISIACIHLGRQPTQCVAYWPGETRLGDLGHPDGRPCQTTTDCGDDDENAYSCEHAGWLGLTSVDRRVRYAGTLQDPNEVALFVSATLPFAFAFYQRRRNHRRLLLAAGSALLVALTVRYTQSRGGLLVLLAVALVYAVQRFGVARVVKIGIPLAIPAVLFMLGGDGRSDADESTDRRLRCMLTGLQMFARWPVLGVGFGQFTQHHDQTAHNSYVLAVAELGAVGLMLWTMTYYLGIKTVLLALRRCQGSESEVARIWGSALNTSLVGMSIGLLFLSFTYHFVLWIYFGLVGAFYGAVGAHDRGFSVPLGWRDALVVFSGNALLLLAIWVYTSGSL